MGSRLQNMNRRDVLRLGAGSLLGLGLERQASAQGDPMGHRVVHADVCVYGGTSAGVMAAIQARRMKKRVVLLDPGKHLGGMTASGLGGTDIGERRAVGGLALEFYRRVLEHYSETYGPNSLQRRASAGGIRFEPSVAEKTFNEMAQEADVPVFFGKRLREARKAGNQIVEIEMEDGTLYRAGVFIDASYEGDLMALARVAYTVGREANAQYGETHNGIQLGRKGHQFKVPVDPYLVEGDPSSGLLPGISADPPGVNGDGDRRVQAYCYRLCLTDDTQNRIAFFKPEGYDPERYTLLARYINACVNDALRVTNLMPNGKTDTNTYGAFSLDHIGMSYGYPDADWETRDRIIEEHTHYTQGLLWFLATDERVPQGIREETRRWGVCKDEFTDNSGWPWQLYVREARRMLSPYVMTEHNCTGKARAEDSVGLGAYAMDSHHCRRLVVDGRVVNEGDVQVYGNPPYPIAYRSLVPREAECGNLIVPVCVSASHIAYGSIRMEPVFMILGQSAATAACLALDAKTAVQQVDYQKLRARLIEDEQVLEWPPPVPPPPFVGPPRPKTLGTGGIMGSRPVTNKKRVR